MGSFKGVVGKGIDFLSSNPKMKFPRGGRGMGSFTTMLWKRGSLHKKMVMFISSLAKDYLFVFLHEVFPKMNT